MEAAKTLRLHTHDSNIAENNFSSANITGRFALLTTSKLYLIKYSHFLFSEIPTMGGSENARKTTQASIGVRKTIDPAHHTILGTPDIPASPQKLFFGEKLRKFQRAAASQPDILRYASRHVDSD